MANIELRTGLDYNRFKENFGSATKKAREEQLKIWHREEAWKYTLKYSVESLINKVDFIQTYLNDDISELNLQILLFFKKDIGVITNLFNNSPDWKTSNDTGNIDDYNNRIRYIFYPTHSFWQTLQNRYKISNIYFFRINLDFFPDEDGECKIVDLGEQEVSYTKHVFSIECKDGADLWEKSQ